MNEKLAAKALVVPKRDGNEEQTRQERKWQA
jgi:hypothetical protein